MGFRLPRYTASILLTGMLLTGCATTGRYDRVRIEPVQALLPDTTSAITVDVRFIVPAEALHRRSRLVIVPQWLQQDSVWTEYRPVVLDAPIYVQKMHRRKKLTGYVDSLEHQAQAVTMGKEIVVPYRERIVLPEQGEGGRLVAMLSTDGCGSCGVVDTLDMAYLTTLPLLLDPAAVRDYWLEKEFAVRPKVMQGKGEALLQFIINKHDINLELGRNREELQRMQAALGPVLRDSLATVNQLTIYGMASADGSLNFNTGLAARRAASAQKWLTDQLAISPRVARKFKVGSRPEGWEPVLEAMRKDGHPDTLKVQEILERYAGQSDDKAEYYIRRLACWKDIKNNYLQKDRKVVYEYSYTLKSFTTNKELLEMYTKRPDAFNEEELLKVASLKEGPEEKEEVYRTTLHYFPQSVTAAHNLAALLLRKGAYAEAEQVLEPLPAAQPELRNMRAVLALVRGDYRAAIAGWEADTESADTRYNLGLAYALLHRFDEAYRWLQEFDDTNAALVSLCAEQTDRAQAQMTACTDCSPKAAYVRALVAARRNDKAEVLAQLRKAAAEPQWLNRAAGEVEFRTYWKDADFNALVKGGTDL